MHCVLCYALCTVHCVLRDTLCTCCPVPLPSGTSCPYSKQFMLICCSIAGAAYAGHEPVIHYAELAKAEYRGAYVCKASNMLGSLAKEVFVDVLCKYLKPPTVFAPNTLIADV